MSDKRDWLKCEVVDLIDLYHNKPELWDVKSQIYKDRVKKLDAVKEIAMKFNTAAEEINRKLHNLRNQFNSELKKTMKKKSGQGTDELYVSKWPYFKSLSFLQGGSVCRQPIENIPEDNAVEVKDEHEQSNSQDVSTSILQNIPPESPVNPNKRKKIESLKQNDLIYQEAVLALSREDDQYDIFGKYVASEMRNLSSEYLRKKMKRQFQRVIMEIYEEEESLSSVS